MRCDHTRNSPACPMDCWLPRGHTTWSVIHPLDEPLVPREVVIQLAQHLAVEQHLPVLAHDAVVPPTAVDLPASDGVDSARPPAGDVDRYAAWLQRHRDRVWRREHARHPTFTCVTIPSP